MSFLRFQLSSASLKKADRMIAVSDSSRQLVESIFPGTASQWDVVYNGNPVRNGANRIPNNTHETPFLLSSSKYVAYANQLNLLRAYGLLRRRRNDLPPLLLAGGVHDRHYFNQVQLLIQEQHLETAVRILGLVSHDHLMTLYANATAFLFPSTLEACPHSLIEAMAWGLPIAASRTQPMPEICQDGAVFFDPSNPEEIAAQMEAVIFDEHLRRNLRKQALERCRFFTWEKTARDTLRVLKKAALSNQLPATPSRRVGEIHR